MYLPISTKVKNRVALEPLKILLLSCLLSQLHYRSNVIELAHHCRKELQRSIEPEFYVPVQFQQISASQCPSSKQPANFVVIVRLLH